MKARSVLAIAAMLLACVAVVSLLRRHGTGNIFASFTSSRMPSAGASASATSSVAPPGEDRLVPEDAATIALPPAPSRELIGKDARAAARAWQARAAQVVFAKDVREFGLEIARLLQLPPDQAWGPLSQRAAEGDLPALLATSRIESLCRFAESDKPKSATPLPYPGLPAGWDSFVAELRALQRESREQRVSHCVDVGKASDFAETIIDRFLRPENPDAQVEIAAENEDAAQAIADLRSIVAKNDTPRGRLLLGDRLLTSQDADESNEGRAMLEKMAPDDPVVAARLAYCLKNGCEGFAADQSAAYRWMEAAAGLGDPAGMAMLYEELDGAGNVVDAWAWSRYTLDLAIAGCFETSIPLYVYIANAVKNETRRKSVLTPVQQNAGLATLYAISGRWERQAKERLACAN